MNNDTRPFPENEQAEKSVLSCLLSDPEKAWPTINATATERWFNDGKRRALFSFLKAMRADSQPLHLEAIAARMLETGFDKTLTVGDVVELAGWEPATSALPFFLNLLREKFVARETLAALADLADACHGDAEEFPDARAAFFDTMAALAAGESSSALARGDVLVAQVVERLEADMAARAEGMPTGRELASTGLRELDDKLGGLVRGQWVIGAETSGGKTVLLLQLALAALKAGERVVLFAYEMPADTLVRRMLSAESGLEFRKLMGEKDLTAWDIGQLTRSATEVGTPSLLICDNPATTLDQIEALTLTEHAKSPVGFVGVDYIQLVPTRRDRFNESRQQEVARISSTLKRLSGRIGCSLVSPTQLNESGQTREARDIIFDADIGLRIGPDGIECVKNRNGERHWTAKLSLVGERQRFEPRQF